MTGIVTEKLPFEKYNELPGLRVSSLKHALVSALEYQAKAGKGIDRDKFRLGRAGHTAILEVDRFLREYVEVPVDKDGKAKRRYGKAWDAFCEEHKGKTKLLPDQFATAMKVRDAVRDHPEAGPLVKGLGRNELTLQWNDKRTGELCKGRLDRLTHTEMRVLVDIKLTADPSLHPFTQVGTRLHYPMQLAFYRDGARACGLGVTEVKIIAAQSVEPFDVVVYDFGDDVLRHGQEEYEHAIDVVLDARAKKRWLGQATEHAIPFMLPAWVMKAGAEEDFGTSAVTFDGEQLI